MSKKVLVVDDDFKDLTAMKTILENGGFETVVVSNGAQALDSLEGSSFDLILVDIRMPTLSGYDLLRLMRERLDGKSKMAYVSIVPRKDVDEIWQLWLSTNRAANGPDVRCSRGDSNKRILSRLLEPTEGYWRSPRSGLVWPDHNRR